MGKVNKNELKSKSLFEIEYEYQRTIRELEEYCITNNTDEVPEEMYERLFVNQDELEHKLYNYYLAMQHFTAKQEVFKYEEQRIKAKRNALQKGYDYLRGRIAEAVIKFGSDTPTKSGNPSIKTDFLTASYIKKQNIVPNVDIEHIPLMYKKHTITVEVCGIVPISIAERINNLGAYVEVIKVSEPIVNMAKVESDFADDELPSWLTKADAGYLTIK
jgi:hypothetical protein